MWDNMLPAGGKETSSYNIILQSYLTRNNCSYIMRTKVRELLFLSYNKGGEKSRGEIRNSTEFSQEADMRSRKLEKRINANKSNETNSLRNIDRYAKG